MVHLGSWILLLLPTIALSETLPSLDKIFKGSTQVKNKCGGTIGTPDLVYTGVRLFAVSGCHGSGFEQTARNISAGLRDKVEGHSCVMKSSADDGETWDSWTVLTPTTNSGGYGSCKAVFDAKRSTMIVQYAYYPYGDSGAAKDVRYFQRKCSAAGDCQSEVEITQVFAPCPGASGMAGSRIQLKSGRILFGASADEGHACVWYSDDGGDSWTARNNDNLGKVNEFSLVELDSGEILMNGRQRNDVSGWPTDHRAIYRSTDQGVTWTGPVADKTLRDSITSAGHGTSMSIINTPAGGKHPQSALIFFGPHHDGRNHMHVHCSLDSHETWPGDYAITETDEGGYSALIYLPQRNSGKIMLAWKADDGNIWRLFLGRDFCGMSDSVMTV